MGKMEDEPYGPEDTLPNERPLSVPSGGLIG